MEILGDFQTTMRKALTEIDPKWKSYNGLVVCGSHNPRDWDTIIDQIRVARKTGRPFLGVCYGHQLAAIEYARNVLGIKNATSEEFGESGTYIVKKRPELKVGWQKGETWWSNYEIDIELEKQWKKPRTFITTPFHPEYESSYWKPHSLLVQFIDLCKK